MLSALIQNFDTVEKAIETSANSAGSALKENERYLDSIQGKIDQFNNAMQAMWSDTLDSDLVKGFVSFGTILIKIIDTIGLLESALIALATISMIKNKMGPISFFGGISEIIRAVAGKVRGFIGSLTGMAAATSAYTAETLAASVANGTLTATEAANIATKNGLTLATTKLNAAEAVELLTKGGMQKADALAIVSKLGLSTATKKLTADTLASKMAAAGYKEEQIATATAALFGAGANQTLAASFGALWAAMWPILAVMAGIAAIYGVVKLFDALFVSAKEASEQLEETKNRISDLESELESLQTELDAAREKIAELVALPHLSLTQQEDLDRLEREVELLERQIALKERQLAIEEAKLVEDAELAVKKNWGPTNKNKKDKKEVNKYIEQYEVINEDSKKLKDLLNNWEELSASEREVAAFELSNPYTYDLTNFYSDDPQQVIDAINLADTKATDLASKIEEIFGDTTYAGLEYGMSDEIDGFLDDFNNAQLKWEKALYGNNSAVSIIESLWGPSASEEMKAVKSEIDKIMAEDGNWASDDEKWQSKNTAIKNYIESLDATADGYHQLDYVINDLGTTAQDISDYFTVLNGAFNSNTIEGIAQQYARAEEVIGALKDMSGGIFMFDGQSYNWDEFFSQDDQGKFKARVDKFAEILKGMDIDTRETFVKIVESAVNAAGDLSKIDWDQAIAKLDFSGLDRTFELLNNEFEGLNNEMFAGAADDINGLIDTVSELQAALEDVAGTMDLLHTAQSQMNSSGRVSVKTALELMQTTEDWDQILEITNGTIRLRQGAEEHLIQTELTAIQTQLHYAWTTAKARYETALAAQGELAYADNSGVVMTAESIKAEAIGRVSAVVVALGAAMDEITKGNWGSAFSAFGSTYQTATATVVQDAKQYTTTLSELKTNADNAEKLYNAGLNVTPSVSDFKDNWDFDETPGDKYEDKKTKEEEIEDAWEKLIAKYDNQLALLSNQRDRIEAEIDKAEARGGKASTEYYDDLINNSKMEKNLLIQKKAALEEYLRANDGAIDQDTWTEYNNTINETAVAIKECEINIIEWAEAIREIDLHYFERASDEISRLGDELEFVNSLLEDEEIADENGNWSSAALTRMGMYTNQLEMAAVNAARYQEKINDLGDEYENGTISEEQYQERLSDLVSSQQDAIMSYEDAKDSIVELNEARVDAIREGIEREIEAYEDLIDAKKEELDAERDLHDFRENIKKQTKDIGELERRIASLSGSSAASDVAERRRLEAQLMEAKEGLNDTYYDHSRDAQSAALDEENEAYALSKEKYIERLEEQLKDTETLISNSIMDVMLNADTVYNELNTMADTYGITLSDELTQPWKDASAQAIAWKDELRDSMTSGEYAALIGEGGAVTAFANGVATKLQGSWAKAETAAKNYAGYLTGAELKNGFTNTLTGFGNQIQGIIDKWNGVKKAADDAYVAQTRKVTVGGTSTGTGSEDGSNLAPAFTPAPQPDPSKAKTPAPAVKLRGLMQTSREMILGSKSFVDANTETINGVKYYRDSKTGYYYKISDLNSKRKYDGGRTTGWAIPKGTWFYTKNAKGTTGTKRDEWGLTDEPQFGDELVLIPTPQGNLSYMRKGTGVVPADLTANLMEWGQFTPDSMNLGGGVNVNMINNAVNKPEFNFTFDALVKAERIDENTLPEVKKFVQQEINSLVKQMNYAIKGKGAR